MTAPAQASAQDRYTQAAVAAAALYAASRTPAPADVQTLAAVRGAAAAVQSGITVASRMITALWASTDPYDPAAVDDFAEQAGRVVVGAQRAAATATTAAQVMMLRSAGVVPGPISADIPDDVRGASVHFGVDAPTVHRRSRVSVTYRGPDDSAVRQSVTASDAAPSRIYSRAAAVYRVSVAQGDDSATANTAAVQRITDITDGNVMLAQRLAEQQTLRTAQSRNPSVTGYRRVIHPELSKGGVCGLCVAASDRVYHVEDLKPIHFRCKCGVVPVVGDSDMGYQLNKRDLRSLYTETGKLHGVDYTTEGAHLKRTRYDVVHHAELGPVLTRVRGEKVPYYTTTPPAVLVAA